MQSVSHFVGSVLDLSGDKDGRRVLRGQRVLGTTGQLLNSNVFDCVRLCVLMDNREQRSQATFHHPPVQASWQVTSKVLVGD